MWVCKWDKNISVKEKYLKIIGEKENKRYRYKKRRKKIVIAWGGHDYLHSPKESTKELQELINDHKNFTDY